MSIGFRVAIAGWQTASVQFGQLPEPQHLTQSGVPPQQALTK
jgi:hypothetical protein